MCNCPNKKIEIYWEQGIGRVVKYLCPCPQKENLIQEKNPLEEIHSSEESNPENILHTPKNIKTLKPLEYEIQEEDNKEIYMITKEQCPDPSSSSYKMN